jgi:hypothetical protein
MDRRRLLVRITGGATANVGFRDFVDLIEGFGFRLHHVRGSHHIFRHPKLPDRLNLQDDRGQAKPYQLRQFLDLVERYNLKLED